MEVYINLVEILEKIWTAKSEIRKCNVDDEGNYQRVVIRNVMVIRLTREHTVPGNMSKDLHRRNTTSKREIVPKESE